MTSTETTVHNRCTRCGKHAEPTAAVMAAHADHVACRLPRLVASAALTAGAHASIDALVIDLWSARRRLSAFTREGGRR